MKNIKKICLLFLSIFLLLLNINLNKIGATEVSGSLMGFVPYKIWINKDKQASDTILGQTILESKNFDNSGKISQAMVAAPAKKDAEFKLNAEFYLNQAASVMGYELWNILSKPAVNTVATLPGTRNAAYSHVDLVVEFNNYLEYKNQDGVIKNAYFDSKTWRPIYVFNANTYEVLEDFRNNDKNTYTKGVSKKIFDIHTKGAKKFIIRVIPIADEVFSAQDKTAPLKFGLDEENNFTVSTQKSNELAAKRREMTEQQIADEKAIMNKVINTNSQLTPAQTTLMKEYNIYATGEVTGQVYVDKSKLGGWIAMLAPSSLPLTGMIPAAGIAVAYKNPSVLFVKNDGTDKKNTEIREDKVDNGRIYVDYDSVINKEKLAEIQTPTREGYKFLGWATEEAAQAPNFNPETEKITKDVVAYAVWKKTNTVHFDSNIDGVSKVIHTSHVESGKSIDEDLSDESVIPENPEHPKNFKFKEWNTDKNGTGTKFDGKTRVDQDMTVYAIYTEQYSVSYKFVSEDGTELPEEIKKQLPTKDFVDKGSNVVAPQKLFDEVKGYEFKGWKIQKFDNITNDVEFEGVWNKTELDLEYLFVSSTPEHQPILSAELDGKLPQKRKIRIGDSLTHPDNFEEVYVSDSSLDGRWRFKEWSVSEKKITPKMISEDGKRVLIVGTWDFVLNTYDVRYRFVSLDPQKNLPDEIEDYFDNVGILTKTKYTVKPPRINELKDDVNDGKWIFSGYNKEVQEVDKENLTFIGKYKFIPNIHKLTFEFKSEDSKYSLPDEVMALLPSATDSSKVNDGTPINIPQLPEIEDKKTGGKWVFVGFDRTHIFWNKKDEVVVGKWKLILPLKPEIKPSEPKKPEEKPKNPVQPQKEEKTPKQSEDKVVQPQNIESKENAEQNHSIINPIEHKKDKVVKDEKETKNTKADIDTSDISNVSWIGLVVSAFVLLKLKKNKK